jgi:hypothetical protein
LPLVPEGCRWRANPTFAQSRPLGGADADIVVDDLLLAIKVTARALDRRNFFQLIGYLLADTDDEFLATTTRPGGGSSAKRLRVRSGAASTR